MKNTAQNQGSPVLTGLSLSRHSLATADVLGASVAKSVFGGNFPPNKPNLQLHLNNLKSTT
jgi:hypothetical protein